MDIIKSHTVEELNSISDLWVAFDRNIFRAYSVKGTCGMTGILRKISIHIEKKVFNSYL